MAKTKIAVTVDKRTLGEVDRWVRQRRYPSRSQAVEAALEAAVKRQQRQRLAEEAAKLDPVEEKALAEEGMGANEWPAY
jgi:metal-responsive CopG/Arc/MetJ family transcriptional regulator